MEDSASVLSDVGREASSYLPFHFHREASLLSLAYANTSQREKADALFRQVTKISTSSETYYNYACFLASRQRNVEAREWARQILAKKPSMPGYLRRRERPWFRQANSLLKRFATQNREP